MLGSSGEGLITKLASYLTADKHPVTDETLSTDNKISLADPILNNTTREESNATNNGDSANPISKAGSRRSIARSASEMVVPSQYHNERLTVLAGPSAVQFKEGEHHVTNAPQHLPRITLQPLRRTTQRSMSSSRVELSSPYHDPTISSIASLRQHVEQPRSVTTSRLPRPVRARQGSFVNRPATRTRPSPTRSTALRSCSDPDLAKAFANPKTRTRNVPLKPCIKKKADSSTAPASEETRQAKVTVGSRTLRRVKTVDFEGNGSRLSVSLLPDRVTIDQVNQVSRNGAERIISDTGTAKKAVKKLPSCPSTIGIMKSSVADTAVTRTDVHVIAIAPQWDAQDVTNEEDVDPATPTMQIIETKSASYEIVWDDVPAEHSVRIMGRRSSSASHALEAATPGATRGLERVNTKLAGWSGTWNTRSERFNPTFVVFPDDDGRAAHHDCAVEVEDGPIVSAPPNSRMTSCASSRLPSRPPSRPTSAPMTRTASREEKPFSDALEDMAPQFTEHPLPALEQPLVEPDHEVRFSSGRNLKQATGFRKLSNVEDADTKFRGHRDSVTIAHSRLIRSEVVSSEPFAHRDSISMGKRRIRARSHATSVVRAIPYQREMPGETRKLIDDDDMLGVSLPTVPLAKERAAPALQNSSFASKLRSPKQTPNQRHIRIVE